MTLDKDKIRQWMGFVEEDFRYEPLGGSVRIRTLSMSQRWDVANKSRLPDGKIDDAKWRLWTVVHGCVNPKFDEKDLEWMDTGKAGFVEAVSSRIWDISGVPMEAEKNGQGLGKTNGSASESSDAIAGAASPAR